MSMLILWKHRLKVVQVPLLTALLACSDSSTGGTEVEPDVPASDVNDTGDANDIGDANNFTGGGGLWAALSTVCELVDASCGNGAWLAYSGSSLTPTEGVPFTTYSFSGPELGVDFTYRCGFGENAGSSCPGFIFEQSSEWFVVWSADELGVWFVAAYADTEAGAIDHFGNTVLLPAAADVAAAFEALADTAPNDCGRTTNSRVPDPNWCPSDTRVIEPQ